MIVFVYCYRGIKSLQDASEIIKSEFKGDPIELNLTGISSFGSQVAFVSVSHETEENLKRISSKSLNSNTYKTSILNIRMHLLLVIL